MEDEILLKYLKELETNFINLNQIKVENIKELRSNIEKQWAILHGLQIIIQNILDIGNHILTSKGINNIETYGDIIKKLGENQIIPEGFAKSIQNLAGFRNILVHEYIMVDLEKVFFILTNKLCDVEKFIQFIASYIEKN